MLPEGVLHAVVWPIYVGFGTDPDENLPQDQRHPITWAEDQCLIVGHANPLLDAGVYPYLLFFHHPTDPPSFAAGLEHPYRQTVTGRKHIGPIFYTNNEITAHL